MRSVYTYTHNESLARERERAKFLIALGSSPLISEFIILLVYQRVIITDRRRVARRDAIMAIQMNRQ